MYSNFCFESYFEFIHICRRSGENNTIFKSYRRRRRLRTPAARRPFLEILVFTGRGVRTKSHAEIHKRTERAKRAAVTRNTDGEYITNYNIPQLFYYTVCTWVNHLPQLTSVRCRRSLGKKIRVAEYITKRLSARLYKNI